MKNMRKKLAAAFLAFAMAVMLFPAGMLVSYAATGKITFSDPTVSVGNQVSVNMKITSDGALGASDVKLEYDASALEFVSGTNANGGAGSVRVLGSMESADQKTFSFTLKFKALKAGTSNIKVTSQEVYDASSQTVELSHVGSSAVKVSAPEEAGKDASLSSLTISPGELSPAFSADVTEYTATVSGDVNDLAVSAPAKDSKASVSVSGNEGLQVGENKVSCKVTAEDGETTKTYTITVTKTEGEAPSEEEKTTEAGADGKDVNVAVDEGSWEVAETFEEGSLPDGFTMSECDYNGKKVQSAVNEDGVVLLYMTNESGTGDFFVYDAEKGTLSPYVVVKMAEKKILVLPPSLIPEDVSLPEGFTECSIDIGDHTVHGWIWGQAGGEAPEYCMVYGRNEAGEENFYRYDQKEMTLQRYFQDPDATDARAKYLKVAEDYNSLIEDYTVRGYLVAGLFALCIILLIVVIVLLLTRKPGGPDHSGKNFYREEKGRKEYGDFEADGQTARRAAPRRSGDRRAEASSRRPESADWEPEEPAAKRPAKPARRAASPARGESVASVEAPVRRAASPARAESVASGEAPVRRAASPARGESVASGEAPVRRAASPARAVSPASGAPSARRTAAGAAQRPAPAKTAPAKAEAEPDDDFEFIDLDL